MKKPELKKVFGCDGPPIDVGGAEGTYRFPPDSDHPVEIDRCPQRYLMDRPDVVACFRALNLADGRISVSEQGGLPPPYLEALSLISCEQNAASSARLKG